MGDYGGKAGELVKKADKKLTTFSFFGNKYEDAAELYDKAVTQYKLAKLCECFTVLLSHV
jgi:alpha-soluble NSF attachment protein